MKDLLILEVAEGVAGPTCGLQCVDLGARVVKVEPVWGDRTREWGPPLDSGSAAIFEHLNSGKESAVLDAGQLDALLGHADAAVVQADPSDPDTPNWADVARRHPRLVLCEIVDFGGTGRFAGWTGSELTVQAMSGITNYVGDPGGEPCRVGFEVAGTAAGMHAFQAIAAGLFRRNCGGDGQHIRVSSLGSLLSMQTILFAVQSGGTDDWTGFHLNGPHGPADTAWDAADGQVTLDFRPGLRDAWVQFCEQVGLPELPRDPDYAEWRSTIHIGDRRFTYGTRYGERFASMTCEEVTSLVNRLGGISVKFHDYGEMLAHPQVRQLEPLLEVPGAPLGATEQVGMPFSLPFEAKPAFRRPAPRLGEHTPAVLAALQGQAS